MVMMEVSGKEPTEDLKLAFTRIIYTALISNASVLKIKDISKLDNVEKIVHILKQRQQWEGIRPFLLSHPCFFQVTEENNIPAIKPMATIEFCRDFDGKKGCSKNLCSKLHVCRHFVKGKCTFGPRCKKPHHFEGTNTREVLRNHFLDALSDDHLREFLCRNVQHLLEQDSINSEVPKSLEICKYYNVATGCTRDFCPYIHVCRFYAEEGNCKFGSQCIRKHEIDNCHSKILLNRYQMDGLTEQQVMAYLRLKAERREDQPEKTSPPVLSPSNTPLTLPHSYPTTFSMANDPLLQAMVNMSRKQSNPLPPFGMSLFDDSRKFNMQSKPVQMNKPASRTDDFLQTTSHSNIDFTRHSNSFTSDIQDQFSHRRFPTSRFSSENVLLDNPRTYGSPVLTSSIHNIQRNSFEPSKLNDDLGLNNLSPPSTITHETSFHKSKSTDHFSSLFNKPQQNGIHHPNNNNGSLYSNFSSENTSLLFNRGMFTRASSSDICSPTGSLSSVPPTESSSARDFVMKLYSEKGSENDLFLPYYRTQSLPNFSKLNISGDVPADPLEDTPECSCQLTKICVYFLRGNCSAEQCKLVHSDERFLWQVYNLPLTNKKENGKWIDVGKNENLKLESDYCSVEIEHSEINFYGESITIKFDKMIGVGQCEINTNSKTCDLSSWLLQASDETLKSQQETVTYKVRRLSTPSAMEGSAPLPIHWMWFWQDNFGMWRSYPQNKADLIETTNACFTQDIEAKFNEGVSQHKFVESNIIFDFKNMLHINCNTGKKRQIRRRPKYSPKEHQDIICDAVDTNEDIRQPSYWNESSSTIVGEYKAVPLQDTSNLYNTVAKQLANNKNENEIHCIMSIRNSELWNNHYRFRQQMEKADLKVVEKFVYKSVERDDLCRIFQQGFTICDCLPNQNIFSLDASKPTSKYVIYARMNLPENEAIESESGDVTCRHSHQVYPEFLIIYKVL